MTSSGLKITHIDAGSSGEYRAKLPDSDGVGRLTWKELAEGVRVADHTLVPPEIGGRGIAAKLVEALVADAKRQGFRIVPQCSYVAAKFAQNPDWSDVRA